MEEVYQNFLKKQKEIYNKFGVIYCSGLKTEVIFNSIGFKHLLRKAKRRTRKEQRTRFYLFKYIPEIMNSKNSIVLNRIERLKNGKNVSYWGIEKEIGGLKIKVIVRQVGQNGKKHFYSIMQKTSKNPA